jgi:tRNA G18 (ribose-2'-O)-methylase SpoU
MDAPGLSAIAIEDPDDPRIADYRLVRDRDLAGRGGLFVAEGLVVLEKLIARGRHGLRSVLVADAKLPGARARLAGLPPQVPVYAASQSVMDAIVGFPIHRGVLAIGARTDLSLETLLAGLAPRALVLAVCGVSNHDNMGGLFRNAAAFGADAVLLDETCCDPLYRKAIRVSVGACLTTDFARDGTAADLALRLQSEGFEVLALTPWAAETLDRISPAPRQALMLGAEGPGLSEAVLRIARPVAIRMAGGFDSLNVSVAAGVALHHLATFAER